MTITLPMIATWTRAVLRADIKAEKSIKQKSGKGRSKAMALSNIDVRPSVTRGKE